MTSTPSSGEAGASDANEAVLPTASPESDRYFDHAGALVADDLHPFGERATTLLLSALAPRRGQRLLELGCGTGKALARPE